MTEETRAVPTSPEVDSLLLEVVRGRLQSVVDEAGATIIRTAFSVVMTEAKDFACAILLPDCSTVVQSIQSIPVFLATMTETSKHLVAYAPLETWKQGDVYATNDPWLGTGHLYDITLVSPVVIDGQIVALSAVVGHLPDIGGKIVGTDATQCFEEGLRLPPMRLVSEGVLDRTAVSILEANVRTPEHVLGDLEALLNAGAVIEERLIDLVSEIGADVLSSACLELDRRTEAAMRSAIASVPDGVYSGSVESEGIGGVPFVIQVTVGIEGDEAVVDFTGSSKQIPAGVNACLNYTSGYVASALKSLLIPSLPFNQGVLRPIRVTAPEATIVNSKFPAPGAARAAVGHFVPGLVFKAMSGVLASETIAECGAPRPSMRVSGVDPTTGSLFTAPVFAPGGFGARERKDGPPCIAFPTNASTVPIEMSEINAPILFEEKELLPNSGGPGRMRGGLGQRITVRALAGDLRVSVVAQRIASAPQGIYGGGDGLPARFLLNDESVAPSGSLPLAVGETATLESPGGGGYGDPHQRDRQTVSDDVANGYVTLDEAWRVYGWKADP